MRNFLLGFMTMTMMATANAQSTNDTGSESHKRYSCEYQRSLAKQSDEVIFGGSVESRVETDFDTTRNYKRKDIEFSNLGVTEKKIIRKIGNCTLKKSLEGQGIQCIMGRFTNCDSYALYTDGYAFLDANEQGWVGRVTSDTTYSYMVKMVYKKIREDLNNCLCE